MVTLPLGGVPAAGGAPVAAGGVDTLAVGGAAAGTGLGTGLGTAPAGAPAVAGGGEPVSRSKPPVAAGEGVVVAAGEGVVVAAGEGVVVAAGEGVVVAAGEGVVVAAGEGVVVTAAGEGEAGPVSKSKMAAHNRKAALRQLWRAQGEGSCCLWCAELCRGQQSVQCSQVSARGFLGSCFRWSPCARAPPANASIHASINATRRLPLPLLLLPGLLPRRPDGPRSCRAADMLRLQQRTPKLLPSVIGHNRGPKRAGADRRFALHSSALASPCQLSLL